MRSDDRDMDFTQYVEQEYFHQGLLIFHVSVSVCFLPLPQLSNFET